MIFHEEALLPEPTAASDTLLASCSTPKTYRTARSRISSGNFLVLP
jgi:hypothetical protein